MAFLYVQKNRRISTWRLQFKEVFEKEISLKEVTSISSPFSFLESELKSKTNRRQAFFFLCLVFLSMVLLGCRAPQETPPVDLTEMLFYTEDPSRAESADMNRLANIGRKVGEESPLWPVYMFLLGEVHRLRGETRQAEIRFERIVAWAAADSSREKWGRSGLAGVALWRLLQLRNSDPLLDIKDVPKLISSADKILKARLVRGMFRLPVLESLPILDEDIKRQSALLAERSNMPREAQRFFLDYLAVSRAIDLSVSEKMLLQRLVEAGMASEDHIALLRGRRLYELRRYSDAAKFLEEARKGENLQVRAEATFYLAMMKSSYKEAHREEKLAWLSEVADSAHDPDLAQNALYSMGRALRVKGEKSLSLKAFERILTDFPLGSRADDALYELAQEYHYSGEVDRSLQRYEELRNFKGRSDFASYSGMDPAMMLYGRNGEEGREAAQALLQDLERRVPEGPYHLNALFWMGRIAADRGDHRRAQEYFKKVIETSPFDYYALRARMHLRMGNRASQSLLPDEETRKELRSLYNGSRHEVHLSGRSAYHLRLKAALDTGLYRAVYGAYQRLRERIPAKRLEDLTVEELEQSGLFPQVSVLLALRQDAFAAAESLDDRDDIAANYLEISDKVGQAGDLPLSMSIIIEGRDIPEKSRNEQRAAMERRAFYLATAYPPCFRNEILAAATQQAGAGDQVSPELVYSILRRESLFCSTALSKAGALGLFQFIPSTFDSLNARWDLLLESGAPSRETFLLNPTQSISLGVRWFNEELLPHHDGHVLFALMEHNAGLGNVLQWKRYWKDLGRLEDVEYIIETIRARETRLFTRRTVADLMVVDAIGLFKD